MGGSVAWQMRPTQASGQRQSVRQGIRFVKNIMAPTRDGTKLALDIHVPAGEGPWPVILTYIPYRKDDQEP